MGQLSSLKICNSGLNLPAGPCRGCEPAPSNKSDDETDSADDNAHNNSEAISSAGLTIQILSVVATFGLFEVEIQKRAENLVVEDCQADDLASRIGEEFRGLTQISC